MEDKELRLEAMKIARDLVLHRHIAESQLELRALQIYGLLNKELGADNTERDTPEKPTISQLIDMLADTKLKVNAGFLDEDHYQNRKEELIEAIDRLKPIRENGTELSCRHSNKY